MKFLQMSLRLVLLVLVLLFSFANAPAAEGEKPPELPRIDLDIGGGVTFAELLTFLREKYPSYSWVVSPEAEGVTLGRMKLRGANLADLGRALLIASSQKLDCTENGATLEVVATHNTQKVGAYNLGSLVAAELEKKGEFTPEAADAARTKLIEPLMNVIDKTCVALGSDAQRPRFEIYPEGNILIVIGNERTVETAAEIIKALVPAAKADKP